MVAKYKILFNGEFRSWVNRDDFVKSFTEQLGGSREKAEALLEVKSKVTLKRSLSDSDVDRYMIAFEKMGMVVTKRLMLKPFVGPCIESGSRMENVGTTERQERGRDGDGESDSKPDSDDTRQSKKSWAGLADRLKSIVGKADG